MPAPVDLSDRPPVSNTMLDQFRGGLCADYITVETKTLPPRLEAAHNRVGALLTTADFGWNHAYEAEKLLARLRLSDSLDVEIARQIDYLKPLDDDGHALFTKRFLALDGTPAPDKGYDDPYVRTRQALLERLLNDLHWGYAQRFLKRLRIEEHTRQVTLWSLAVGLVFLVILVGAGAKGLTLFPYSGLELAALAGLVGSSFSVLTGGAPEIQGNSLEEIRRLTNRCVLFMRLSVGGLAAVILYFFFNAGLIEGLLFPDLEKIGFSGVPSGEGLTQQLRAAFAGIAGEVALSGHAGLRAALGDAQANEALQQALAARLTADEATALGDAPRRAVGELVPNADLSKLLVWSFVAGFSEKFVKTVLGRIEKDAEGK